MITINKLQVFEEKGRPGISVRELILEEGRGILGDRHADGGEKQISILPADIRRWMEATPEKGLCFRRYKENLSLEIPEEIRLKPGDRLVWNREPDSNREDSAGKLQTAEITITDLSKKCFPECPLFSEKKPCRLAGRGVYGKVTGSGRIGIEEVPVWIRTAD